MSTDVKNLDFITLPEVTPQQQKAIELLLLGEKQTAIAKRVKVAPETLSRWKLDANFVAAYNAARLDLWQSNRAKLDELTTKAVDTLLEILNKSSTPIRLQALKIICSMPIWDKPDEPINVAQVELDLKSQHKVSVWSEMLKDY